MNENDIELRKWLAHELGNIINEMSTFSYKPKTDDGYRYLLQKAGLLILAIRGKQNGQQ